MSFFVKARSILSMNLFLYPVEEAASLHIVGPVRPSHFQMPQNNCVVSCLHISVQSPRRRSMLCSIRIISTGPNIPWHRDCSSAESCSTQSYVRGSVSNLFFSSSFFSLFLNRPHTAPYCFWSSHIHDTGSG